MSDTGRYRWVILAAGTAAQASFSALASGLPVLAPAIRSHYGLSLGETGLVLGCVGIGMLPALLPWGLLTDKIGERTVIAVGLGGAAAATGAAASAGTSYPTLLGALVLAGAFGSSVNSASGRAVMGWFGEAERGVALGIRQAANPIGAAAAAASLPWLTSSGGLRLGFLVLAGASALGALTGAVLLREPLRIKTAHIVEMRQQPLRDPAIWHLAGASALYMVAQVSLTTFLVLFLHQYRGLSTHAAAGLLAGVNIVAVGARIGAGHWSDRARSRTQPLQLMGASLTGAMVLVAALVDAPLPVMLPVLFAAGVISLAWNGVSFAAAAEAAGVSRSGAALGLQQTALGVAAAGVPPAFAFVVGAFSWRVSFALAALCALGGVAAMRTVAQPLRDAREGLGRVGE